jgi:hypothetical protein
MLKTTPAPLPADQAINVIIAAKMRISDIFQYVGGVLAMA